MTREHNRKDNENSNIKHCVIQKFILVFCLCVLTLSFCGCDSILSSDTSTNQTQSSTSQIDEAKTEEAVKDIVENTTEISPVTTDSDVTQNGESTKAPTNGDAVSEGNSGFTFSLENIPSYDGKSYIELNNNQPSFEKQEISTKEFETYSSLDSFGRCGVAYANISKETMPTEERGKIGMIKPSGWHTIKYSFVDGRYLYNRCHLIGFQLAGENANEKNLITGTRYLNNNGMLPFENKVAHYVESTDNHVLYRVTPIYDGDNLVASGVQMEAYSVEDKGNGICFNIYVYNCQPGVVIDYKNGDSEQSDTVKEELVAAGLDDYNDVLAQKQDESNTTQVTSGNNSNNTNNTNNTNNNAANKDAVASQTNDEQVQNTCDYIINTNTKKFHYTSCSSTKTMKEKNTLRFTGSRDEVIAQGYAPCKNCNP